MKMKPGFIIREVAGEQVVIPAGMESVDFTKMLVLNDSALLLVSALMKEKYLAEEELADLLTRHYDVDKEQARADTGELLDKLRQLNMLLSE